MSKKSMEVGVEFQYLRTLPQFKGLTLVELKSIIAKITGLNIDSITTATNLTLSDAQKVSYSDMLAKLADGYPIAYLVGHTEFYGLNIVANKGVLIPRPETEQLVDLAISFAKSFTTKVNILEVGSGTGCITVALSSQLTKENIGFEYLAIDISKVAMENTLINLRKHMFNLLVSTQTTSLREFVDSASSKDYDLIVSNPPYLTSVQMANLPTSVKMEPENALFGGEDGLKFYREILQLAGKIQKQNGLLPSLALEADPEIMLELEKLLEELYPGNTQIHKDLFGQDRFITAQAL